MNHRLVFSPVLALLLGACAHAQTMTESVEEVLGATGEGSYQVVVQAAPGNELAVSPRPACTRTTQVSPGLSGASKGELLQRVAGCEEALKQGEAAHATNGQLAVIYAQLGLLYGEEAQWGRAEATLMHSISLLRQSPDAVRDLAETLGGLGDMHLVMGKLHESEKDELEALRLRQGLRDGLLVARSWNQLAILYLRERRYDKAREYAQKATDELTADGGARTFDRVSVRYTLGETLCAIRDWAAAIPVLKAAVADAKSTMRPNEFTIGIGEFLLGIAYWGTGDLDAAGRYMREGTEQMSEQLGWGHPSYVSALGRYEEFLRASRQVEAANDVDRKIRQAQSVVDVHSLQTTRGAFGLAATH